MAKAKTITPQKFKPLKAEIGGEGYGPSENKKIKGMISSRNFGGNKMSQLAGLGKRRRSKEVIE